MDKMTPALLLSAQSVIAKDIEIKWYRFIYILSLFYLLLISSKKDQTYDTTQGLQMITKSNSLAKFKFAC